MTSARVLERHRQSLVNSSRQSSAANATIRTTSASSASANQQQQQPLIDNAFKFYEDKLQTEFRDFRAICSRMILQEKEEKEKWHCLCLKLMKERDTARQRISALISERLSSSASSAQEKNVASKASKRGRDESDSAVSTSSAA